MMPERYTSFAALFCAALLSAALVGCDILEVENPNNLIEDDLGNPAAAPSLANGLEASVARALGAMHAPYHTATGELTWIGSRDAWRELDIGRLDNVSNEFSDAAFPYVAEATWQTRELIRRVEAFREEGTLEDDRTLARLYLYGAIIYTSTADIFDDFVVDSDRREAGEPVGPQNMSRMYDQAIAWLDAAIGLDTGLQPTLYAMRARAKYSRAVWQKLHPSVNTDAPLVNNQGAVDDAREALSRANEPLRYELELVPSSPDLVVGDLSMALQINNRAELGFSETYVATEDDGTIDSVSYTDPLSGELHPYLNDFITEFVAADQYADIPIVGQREMYLILAEAALAGNTGTGGSFADHINALRDLNDLPPYEGNADAQTLLVDSREVNLFLQGRRLADHYRFSDPSPQWTESRNAPGTFFPITITEIQANPNLSP
jgi:hypothetical protein